MGLLLFGYVYILIGCLAIIIGVFVPINVVGKIIIRSKKVLNKDKYIRRHKIVSILGGIFAIFVGFIFVRKGLIYLGILNVTLLAIILVGGFYRDKLLAK